MLTAPVQLDTCSCTVHHLLSFLSIHLNHFKCDKDKMITSTSLSIIGARVEKGKGKRKKKKEGGEGVGLRRSSMQVLGPGRHFHKAVRSLSADWSMA